MNEEDLRKGDLQHAIRNDACVITLEKGISEDVKMR